jgi:hypothetical protein
VNARETQHTNGNMRLCVIVNPTRLHVTHCKPHLSTGHGPRPRRTTTSTSHNAQRTSSHRSASGGRVDDSTRHDRVRVDTHTDATHDRVARHTRHARTARVRLGDADDSDGRRNCANSSRLARTKGKVRRHNRAAHRNPVLPTLNPTDENGHALPTFHSTDSGVTMARPLDHHRQPTQ